MAEIRSSPHFSEFGTSTAGVLCPFQAETCAIPFASYYIEIDRNFGEIPTIAPLLRSTCKSK